MKTFLIICGVSVVGGIIAFFKAEQQPVLPDLTSGKCIIQLNYGWNKSNDYIWKSTPAMRYYYISLDKFPDLRIKMKIKTVPTLIVLQDGKEVKRYEGALLMKISETQSQICQ